MIKTVCDLLDKDIERYSSKPCCVDAVTNQKYTYDDVYKLSYQGAYTLIKKNIIKKPILIILPSSSLALISMLAIARCGSHYTFVLDDLPCEKIESIINELNPALIICNKALPFNIETISTNDFFKASDEFSNIKNKVDAIYKNILSIDPLYILFTSGSTGKPKGVVITHLGVIDFVNWYNKTFKLTQSDVLLNQCKLCFDNSISDIYTFLKAKATLHFIDYKSFIFPQKVIKYIVENEINVFNTVPAILILFAKTSSNKLSLCKKLRLITFAGEKCPGTIINQWKESLPSCTFSNNYGPTEITNICSYYIVDNAKTYIDAVPIGKACDNKEILLIDEHNRLISNINVKGEICVRSQGLSLGYYNNPQKTAEVFIQNPTHNLYKDIIYKTGDIAYYDQDLNLNIVGRKDFQVKIMGYRVELGEIETVCENIDKIQRAVCFYMNQTLYLLYQGQELDLKSLLKDRLEFYKIPNHIYKIENIPINNNGKIDRNLAKKLLDDIINGRE